jgi:hypothetical protein
MNVKCEILKISTEFYSKKTSEKLMKSNHIYRHYLSLYIASAITS